MRLLLRAFVGILYQQTYLYISAVGEEHQRRRLKITAIKLFTTTRVSACTHLLCNEDPL